MAGEPTDLAQLIQRRELTAYEQRMARIAYAYGVDLRRSHWLDDSTLGEPLMRTVDRRWGGLIQELNVEALAPPAQAPDVLLAELAAACATLRSPIPAVRILSAAARASSTWPLATPLGTTKGGMRFLVLDAPALLALEAPTRAFILSAALAHLQCEHGPLFAAHVMARTSKVALAAVSRALAPFSRVAIFSADRAGRLATSTLEQAVDGIRAQLPTETRVKWWPRFPAFEVREQALRDFENSAIVAKLRRARARAEATSGTPAEHPDPPAANDPPDQPEIWSLARCDERLTRRLGLF